MFIPPAACMIREFAFFHLEDFSRTLGYVGWLSGTVRFSVGSPPPKGFRVGFPAGMHFRMEHPVDLGSGQQFRQPACWLHFLLAILVGVGSISRCIATSSKALQDFLETEADSIYCLSWLWGWSLIVILFCFSFWLSWAFLALADWISECFVFSDHVEFQESWDGIPSLKVPGWDVPLMNFTLAVPSPQLVRDQSENL